jgi:hypothetical protein
MPLLTGALGEPTQDVGDVAPGTLGSVHPTEIQIQKISSKNDVDQAFWSPGFFKVA